MAYSDQLHSGSAWRAPVTSASDLAAVLECELALNKAAILDDMSFAMVEDIEAGGREGVHVSPTHHQYYS